MDDKQKTLHLLYLLDNVNIDLAIILAENMAFNWRGGITSAEKLKPRIFPYSLNCGFWPRFDPSKPMLQLQVISDFQILKIKSENIKTENPQKLPSTKYPLPAV